MIDEARRNQHFELSIRLKKRARNKENTSQIASNATKLNDTTTQLQTAKMTYALSTPRRLP
jgi:hypothetical protein